MVVEPSLWGLAYRNLQKESPELIQKFNFCRGISSTDTENENLTFPSLDGVAQEALEKLQLEATLNKTSPTIRKCFEQTIYPQQYRRTHMLH